MSVLIWVQTVCKGYQQTTLVGKELVILYTGPANFVFKRVDYNSYLVYFLNFCIRETPKRVHFSNSEDPDEMPHNATFHLGLHYLLW